MQAGAQGVDLIQVQILRGAFAKSWRALARQANPLSLFDAFGDAHIQRALVHPNMLLSVQLRHMQAQGRSGPVVGIFQVDQNLGMMVLPSGMDVSTATAPTCE